MHTTYETLNIYKVNANSHKGEINSNTKIVEDVNIPLTLMDRSSRQ